MKKFNWLFVINLPILHLKTLGLWPINQNSDWYYCHIAWRCIGCSLFGLCCIISEAAYLLLVPTNLAFITRACSIFGNKAAIITKVFILIKNKKFLQNLPETLNGDSFQPKSKKQKVMVEPRLIVCHKLFKMYYWLVLVLAIFCLCLPFLNQSDAHLLPFAAVYPFNHSVSPFYEISYIHQTIGLWYITAIGISTDILISSLNLYIYAQFTILCNNLEKLHLLADVNYGLLQRILHYQTILNFAKESNNFYNLTIFVQTFITIIITALIMFQLTLHKMFSSDFNSLLILLSTVLYEMFLKSWFGNEVEVQVNMTFTFFNILII